MTKAQDTLRIVHNFLYLLAHGGKATEKEYKLMADLCALSLPMKYRWTREELEALKRRGIDGEFGPTVTICGDCGQPIRPGPNKPGEYEHAKGCPHE